MMYTSTRDPRVSVTASQAIARGISADGGLFVPQEIPQIDEAFLRSLIGMTYAERAVAVMRLYLTDFTEEEITSCAMAAYGERFDTPAVAPLHSLSDDLHLLELWHGPTCAFKDMALQILPHLMRVAVQKAAPGERTVILVATSGDTGKAALEGFKDAPDTRILVFYPRDGVSDMQRLQMVTQEGDNVGVCAIHGNFDDAQTGVKRIFTDPETIERLKTAGMRFSSANSINWGRLLPQIVYYISAYVDLLAQGRLQMGDLFHVAVPTGNFGNILAAYYARCMGLPIDKLICASNRNRVLTDFFTTGEYNCDRPFYTTTSPSMDILISSNLERLLYHLSDCDSRQVADKMESLRQSRRYTVSADTKQQMDSLFLAGFADDGAVAETVKKVFDRYGYLCDTHTAVAVRVCDDYRKRSDDRTPIVVASTANPYKFAPAIGAALGLESTADPFAQLDLLQKYTHCPIPKPLATLSGKQVRFTDECNGDLTSMQHTVSRLLGMD